MSDERDQPPLPFDPAVQLQKPQPPVEVPHEVSFDVFANLLFQSLRDAVQPCASASNGARSLRGPGSRVSGVST